MFKMPKAIHIQVAEPIPTPDAPSPTPEPKAPKDYARLIVVAKHLGKPTALTVGGMYAGKKILDTSCKIAIIAAKAKFK